MQQATKDAFAVIDRNVVDDANDLANDIWAILDECDATLHFCVIHVLVSRLIAICSSHSSAPISEIVDDFADGVKTSLAMMSAIEGRAN